MGNGLRRVYLVRHGQTDANAHGIVQGQSKGGDLNPVGIVQMRLASEFLASRVGADVPVWHSTLLRATASAELVSRRLGGILLPCADIIQRGWGSLEGCVLPMEAPLTPEQAYAGEPAAPLPTDAESTASLRARLSRFTERLVGNEARDHVVVTHNEIANYLLDLWAGSWLTKRDVDTGQVIECAIDSHGSTVGRPRSVFPDRLVYAEAAAYRCMHGTRAMLLLEEHDLTLVKRPGDWRADRVVAAILADAPFGSDDARVFPDLRTVARFGTGVDGVAVDELNSLGISVTRAAGVGAVAVAEFAYAAGVLLLRRVPEFAAQFRRCPGSWQDGWALPRGAGDCLWGIVGCGYVGSALARIVLSSGARACVWNRTWPPTRFPHADRAGVQRAESVEEVCRLADVISVHVALADSTRGLIGERAFEAMRAAGKRPVLVNTCRGDVVDERLLLDALNDGVLTGAAIDVWSAERGHATPCVASLRTHEAVLATPHIAAATSGVVDRTAMRVAQNVIAVLDARSEGVEGIVGARVFGRPRFREGWTDRADTSVHSDADSGENPHLIHTD